MKGYHDPDALLTYPTVEAAREDQVAVQVDGFTPYECPRHIPLVADNGRLTPSIKVKRRVVVAHHAARIDALYA